MPYITSKTRSVFDKDIEKLAKKIINKGELTYCLYRLCLLIVDSWAESYSTYNEIVGALECTKLEFYRRQIGPYEQKKIRDNGDVSGIYERNSD
jgi:hypothetical protein